MHAWFSRKMAELSGTVTYRGMNNELVVCTIITDKVAEHGTGWNDMKYVGVVGDFVRRDSWGSLGAPEDFSQAWRY